MKKILLLTGLISIIFTANAQDPECCPYTPGVDNLRYHERNSNHYVEFEVGPYVYNLSTGQEVLPRPTFPTNKEMISVYTDEGVYFKVKMRKNALSTPGVKKVEIIEPDNTFTDITLRLDDTGWVENRRRWFSVKDTDYISFSTPGLYGIKATFDPTNDGQILEVLFWICVKPTEAFPFPALNATPIFKARDCNISELGVSGDNLPAPFVYAFRYNTNDLAFLNTAGSANISGTGNAYLTIYNPCTGDISSEEISIQLNPYIPPAATIYPADGKIDDLNKEVSICVNEYLIFTSWATSYEDSPLTYSWEVSTDGINFSHITNETGTELHYGPEESSAILNTGSIKEHNIRLIVADTYCNNLVLASPEDWQVFIVSPPIDPSFTLDYDRLRAGEMVTAITNGDGEIAVKLMKWGDGSETDMNVADHIASHKYTKAGNYNLTYSMDNGVCSRDTIKGISIYQPLCSMVGPISGSLGMQFREDSISGAVYLDMGVECKEKILFPCFSGQAQTAEVVATNATKFMDQWGEEYLINPDGSEQNVFEAGNRGKYRPESSYAFNTNMKYYQNDDLTTPKPTSVAGTFPFTFFNYQTEGVSSPGWLNATAITRYSKNGEPLEEYNALGIPSTAHFGYNDAVPILTAQNAAYDEVYFEGYEFTIDPNLQQVYVHSGNNALRLSSQELELPELPVTEHIKDVGLVVQFWVNMPEYAYEDEILSSITGAIDINNQSVPLQKIIVVGQASGWFLVEITVEKSVFSLVGIGDLYQIKIAKNTIGDIFIDDIRMQPFDSQMSTYVYDKTNLRLLAVFDDRNFGMFYQYDEEGRLIRKKIETVEGAKTIQETFYNVPGKPYTNE